MWKTTAMLIFIIVCPVAFGQGVVFVSGSASFGYIATSGNTDSNSSNVALGLLYEYRIWDFEFDLSAVGASMENETTAEAYSSSLKTKRDFNEENYFFGVLDWNKDRFSGYEQQISESFGYGRQLVNGERHLLNVEFGVGARQADLRGGVSRDEAILRGSADYKWIISQMSEFTQDFIVENGSKNTYVESVSALKARVFDDISLVISFTVKSNSDVPKGSKKTDIFSAVSLEYGF